MNERQVVQAFFAQCRQVILTGVLESPADCVLEHEPAIKDVAPEPQHGHEPEQALVDKPVVEPYVPAEQFVGSDEPRRQYDPRGLEKKVVGQIIRWNGARRTQ